MSMQLFARARALSVRAAGMALVALALSACGGGGGSSGDPLVGGGDGGGATVTVAELSVVLDRNSVPNDGSQAVTATVTALDKNRVAVRNVPLSFAADNGGIVQPAGLVTDDKGELKVAVGVGQFAPLNRTITLTAVSGAISKTASFTVVDSTTSEPVATALSMLLDKRTVSNSGSDNVTVTVTATGTGGKVVAGIPITFEVDNGAAFEPSGTVTNASGVWTAVVKIGDNKSNRLINLIAKSGTLTKADRFQVTGVRLSSQAIPGTVNPGSGGAIEYRVQDVNGAPIRNIDVNVSAPGLSSTIGSTDDNGLYVYNYTAPNTSGTLTFSSTAAGVASTQSVVVTGGTTTIPPVTTPVATVPVPVTATPKVLKVNTPTTSNQSQIKVLFLGANNTPVPNVRVRFDFNGNPTPNGSLTSGAALVYSDAQGVAVTNYRAGTTPSPTDGVVVRACWDYNDFAAGTCPNSSLVTLTVVAEGLAVTIGTDDTIEEGATTLTYVKRYVVQVADAAGNPVSSQQLTSQVDLLGYYKGDYRWLASETAWVPGRGGFVGAAPNTTRALPILACANEDSNRNGALELGEDARPNGNANGTLEPRKSDVTISFIGSDRTDASGQAVVKIEYPKSHAGWVGFEISVAADVRSPPAIWTGILPVEATAIERESPPPAFVNSPYGIGASGTCQVAD